MRFALRWEPSRSLRMTKAKKSILRSDQKRALQACSLSLGAGKRMSSASGSHDFLHRGCHGFEIAMLLPWQLLWFCAHESRCAVSATIESQTAYRH